MPCVETMLVEVEPLVIAISKRKLRGWPASMIDDVCQEVRIALWQRILPQYDPSRGTLLGFASTAIHHAIIDQLRRLKRETTMQFTPAELDEIAGEDTSDEHHLDEQLKIVRAAIATMKPTDAALVERLLAGSESDKTVNRSTLAMQKSRTLARLRKILSDMGQHTAA
jgi:RNA polymerase sigma factor (sigma-70 family)